MTGAPLRLGARRSPLARAQVDLVARVLASHGIESEFVGITTTGDLDLRHLTEIGGTGVFAGAVRQALRTGEIDVAVHSLKDLPTAPEVDLEVAAIPRREDTRDVLVGARLDHLSGTVRIGTGAPRRAVQLLEWAADQRADGRDVWLEIVPVRGNVDTRIQLVRHGVVDGVILAAAGLRRLGRIGPELDEDPDQTDIVVSNTQAQLLDHQVMLPAPGQGALALEILTTASAAVRRKISPLEDRSARAETLTERGFLAKLEAGCTAPVGARCVVKSVRGTTLDLTLASVIGRTLLSNLSEPTKMGDHVGNSGVLRWEGRGTTDDPEKFGINQAGAALIKLSDPPGSPLNPSGQPHKRT